MYIFDRDFSNTPNLENFEEELQNLSASLTSDEDEISALKNRFKQIPFKPNLENETILYILKSASNYLRQTQHNRTRSESPINSFMLDNSLEARWSRFQKAVKEQNILKIDAENLWLIGSEVRECLAFGAMELVNSASKDISKVNEALFRRILDDMQELRGGLNYFNFDLSEDLFTLACIGKENTTDEKNRFTSTLRKNLEFALMRAVYGVGVFYGARVHDLVDWDDSEFENTERVKEWKTMHGEPVRRTATGIGGVGEKRLKRPISELNSVDLGSTWCDLEDSLRYYGEYYGELSKLETDFLLRSREELKRHYLIYFGALLSSIVNDFEVHHPNLTNEPYFKKLDTGLQYLSDSLTFHVATSEATQKVS